MKKFEIPEIAFIVNNLLPVFGVIFLGWSAFQILILYWIETIIVCLFSFAKIFQDEESTVKALAGIGFMSVIYGVFLFAHYFAIIIFGAFTDEIHPSSIREGFLAPLWENPTILISIIVCIVSYFISYRKGVLLASPIKRIMIVQASVLIGGITAIFISRSVDINESGAKGIMVGMFILIKNLADMSTYKRIQPSTVKSN